MGLRNVVKKYKTFESKELARRAAKKKKIATYKSLTNKKAPMSRSKRKLDVKKFTNAIGNPYSVKFPKAKKTLRKVKKRKQRKQKVVVIYK